MTHRYSRCMVHQMFPLTTIIVSIGLLGSNNAARSVALGDPPATAPVTAPSTAPSTPRPIEPPTGATPPAKQSPGSEPRSLDDLLGVPEATAGSTSAEDSARRAQEKRLAQSLDEATMQDLVQRAIEGMKNASDRLTDAKDPGLGTQRIQEDVVRTLDRLLDEAQKQQKKKSSSSKKQQSSKKDQKKDPGEQNGQEQKQGQPKPGSAKAGSSQPSDGEKNQSRDDVVVDGQELTESRIEWGQLPERVRELVLQGRRDRVSTIYERLTREYYRRLAEEASR